MDAVAPAAPALASREESRPGVLGRVGAYVALTKPRIIELLLIETVPVMIVAERGLPSLWLVVATVAGGALSAGGANAVNMFIDRDIDALMHRTRNRPLVSGAVTPRAALTFALVLEGVAVAFLWWAVNPLSAVLALGAFAFYVFVYSLWLKRRYTSNIVIGGAAGAVPVLIGWTAVTGTLAWAPWVLFAFVFWWTPPHFWALAVKYRDDYSRAEVPMLPSVASPHDTAVRILRYSVVMVGWSLLFAWVADLGWLYLASAVVLGGVFLILAAGVLVDPTSRPAMRLFGWSITYLTLLFGAMAADAWLGLSPVFG